MSQTELKYDPSICDKLVDYFKDGSSITQVCVRKLNIARSQYYAWKDRYPEFKAAAEKAEQFAEAYHEDMFVNGTYGQIEGFNPSSAKFLMAARFKDTYCDTKQEKTATDSLIEQLVLGKAKIVTNDNK